jgi:hypothetical protein
MPSSTIIGPPRLSNLSYAGGLIFDIGALLHLTSSGHVEAIYAARAMTGMCGPILVLSSRNSNSITN